MSTRPFRSLLGAPELARLNQHTKVQKQLDERWQAALPPALRSLSQAVGLSGDCLIVSTRSPATMAKLRQLETRTLAQLNESGMKVNAIRCRIQVETLPHERKNQKRNLELSPAALNSLQDAAERLPDSPLRVAISLMISRRRGQ